ncbi:hypothetical protein ILYODFUR_037070 [Ilyodon furcidens]|uniref:Uncharacterized protein n=1 Tax=Ilyodon furcidens TaxID=33524 RepID=A0ABV0UNR1_9TELE
MYCGFVSRTDPVYRGSNRTKTRSNVAAKVSLTADQELFLILSEMFSISINLLRCFFLSGAADVSPTQRPTVDPEPGGPGRIGLYVSLGLTAAAAAALMVKLLLNYCFVNNSNSNSVVYQNTEGS